MVLLAEIYCPEQIVIPENFNNVLKAYAKAVIRTQPFDLLRWSAAYFRCLALQRPPPVKPRYEPEARHGQLTAGALRALIDQLGKGYFVQKRQLLDKWQGLCLPEEDLLNILSLLRILDWTHLHWLKIVAIFIGLLSDSLARTAEMICELLTEEPDGGPSPVPLWMFKECFLTVARLDCDSVQTCVDGRKVLDDGQLEQKQPMTEMPKVLSTISFKNAIIDKYKSVMVSAVDNQTTTAASELLSADDRFSEISEVPSKLDSDFKFVGDETNPYNVLRRAPDFDSVIILLTDLKEDNLKQHLDTASISEETLQRAKERTQRLEDLKESLPEYDYEKLMEAERQQLLKDMGPPWLLLYLFSREVSRRRSYNYIEETSLEDDASASGYSDDSFRMRAAEELAQSSELEDYDSQPDHDLGRRRSSYSIPASVRSRMSSVHSSATRIANEVLSRVICMVDEAIIDGECELSVQSISSFIEKKSHDDSSISENDFQTLRDFLEEAEKKELEVKDLNELYHFFVGESFKKADVGDGNRDRSKEITSIFEASGIEVDNNLLDAKISENMILGLVEKDSKSTEAVKQLEPSPSLIQVSALHESLTHVASSDLQVVQEVEEDELEETFEEQPPLQLVPSPEVATQTDSINAKCTELLRRQTSMKSSNLVMEYNCMIPRVPGIGQPLSEIFIETFLNYLAKRATHQQGLIYPRNFREPSCPKLPK
ncbi:uncharacterized protein LOC128745620 [Sabethes cyaneus]|uniref:uncharacterized protein LOC128745620 n=1 Tax=Sabethes cyaneus TaxID=53552 RepID=UPI00237E58B1|nr:uncharacterized protein LOC128745620 [Sabethes cyaneus]